MTEAARDAQKRRPRVLVFAFPPPVPRRRGVQGDAAPAPPCSSGFQGARESPLVAFSFRLHPVWPTAGGLSSRNRLWNKGSLSRLPLPALSGETIDEIKKKWGGRPASLLALKKTNKVYNYISPSCSYKKLTTESTNFNSKK